MKYRHMTYPLALRIEARRVIVVGAGAVAERRIDALLAAGADVTVIAPDATDRIIELATAGLVAWHARPYSAADISEAWLVHAATNVEAVNARVAADADAARVWSIRADDATASAAWVPATTRVDGVSVSVTSDGDPRRSTAIRNAIGDLLARGALPTRPTRSSGGHVVLIGGGPGDPDLITVRGLAQLRNADVVIHDRLSPRELLDILDDDVVIIDAGKGPDDHTLTQDEINDAIVSHALAGRRVARLKGGDPFVLGRGSEEVLACVAAGIRVEVVPGISSALAAPLAAGIPVTHRGTSTGFTVISGHAIGDLSAVVSSGLTLVVLMGVASLPALVKELSRHGMDPTTPVAIIERAHTRSQRTTLGAVGSIVDAARAAGVGNPAVIVVGDVVSVTADALAGRAT